MAMELQNRGTDATGFVLADDDGTIHIWKIADPAWKAVAMPGFHNWADKALTDRTRILLVHTRAYTKGSPHNNENNHPLFAHPIEGVIVHNGMVRNDDALFDANKKLHGFERSCATDSDIFRAILDYHGQIDKALIKEMSLVDGTAAVAAVHRKSPGKLLLLRDSNPLVLGATADTLAFASTKEALHKTLKPWTTLHNIPMQVHAPDLSFIAMPNETGYIIDINATPAGLSEHDVFKCNGTGMGGYVRYAKNTSFWDRQLRARNEKREEKRTEGRTAERTVETVHTPAPAPAHTPINGAKTLVNERPKTNGSSNGSASLSDPHLFEYTICPNDKCNRHVELSADDRKLASIALLACRACGTNLFGGPDAGMPVN